MLCPSILCKILSIMAIDVFYSDFDVYVKMMFVCICIDIMSDCVSNKVNLYTCCRVVRCLGGRFNSSSTLCFSCSSTLSISCLGIMLDQSLPANNMCHR